MLSGLFHHVFENNRGIRGGERLLTALTICLVLFHPCSAQDSGAQDSLAPSARPETPPAELRQLLAQATATAAAEQWDETIDLLQQVQTRGAGFVLPFENDRYLSVGEICQRQLAALPAAGLARYRQRFDEQAAQALEQARISRDMQELTRVVQQWFATSSGDDALWLLGEWHLEAGRPGRAREYWSQLHREALARVEKQGTKSKSEAGKFASRIIFPDTTIPLVEIRARLLLCTISEQRWTAAEQELAKFASDYPNAPGQLGGRKALWAELLRDVLTQARAATVVTRVLPEQTTFAGNAQRNWQSADEVRPRVLTWTAPWQLSTIWQSDHSSANRPGQPDRRIAEDPKQLRCTIPVVTERYLLACDETRVYALNRVTGEPAWPSPQRRRGEIYHAVQLEQAGDPIDNNLAANIGPSVRTVAGLGVPRFTMTVQGSRALARLGSPVTLPLHGQTKQHPSEIVCLDLDRQGLPLWTLRPPGEAWIFEGTPVCNSRFVFQLLRYVDARPQWHVACYDLATGVQQWRTMVCSGEALGRGQIEEISHQLLTLAEGRLFFGTNQGLLAALDADTGAMAWLTQYPRGKSLNGAHWQRDLCPPVYEAGTVYVAPADTKSILALAAGTGEIRWSNSHASELTQLLGTAEGHLIATGRNVWWLNTETGNVAQQWPDNADRNQGSAAPLGRGVLAGGLILWPQRGGLARLHQQVVLPGSGRGIVAAPVLAWNTINEELTGGELLAHREQLIVATGKQVWSLGPQVGKASDAEKNARTARKDGSSKNPFGSLPARGQGPIGGLSGRVGF